MLSKRRYNMLIIVIIIFIITPSSMAARMEISAYHEGQVGHPATIEVSVDSLEFDISGFSILLAIDQSSYAVSRITPGQSFEDCGWEYFTYRIIHDSAQYYNLGSYTDLLNIVGLASVSSGYNPTCYGAGASFDLVEIEFLLGIPYPGNWIDCMWLPIRFFWRDCGDNVLYSRYNDTVYAAAELYDYWRPDPVTYPYPGFGVPDPPCPDLPGQEVVTSLILRNGGIDVACPIYLRGDVNLNGIHYEIADAILFRSYIIWGIPVFTICPPCQLEQCDINFDGMITVADLVLMIRTVIGEVPPYLSSFLRRRPAVPSHLTISKKSGLFTFDASSDVGAVYLRFVSKTGQVFTSSDVTFFDHPFTMGSIGDTTTMLLVDTEGDPVLSTGSHRLFKLTNAEIRLVDIQVVDIYGHPFKVEFTKTAMPEDFSLQQNYPNPFNPATTISFTLPAGMDWSLSIYNITGQLVREFTGHNGGEVEILWDGRDSHGNEVASGVYLYHLTSGGSSAVRKMMLLK